MSSVPQNACSNDARGRWERFISKLFPERGLPIPESTEGFASNYFTTNVELSLSWKDRLRVLLSGRARVTMQSMVDPEITRMESTTVFYVMRPQKPTLMGEYFGRRLRVTPTYIRTWQCIELRSGSSHHPGCRLSIAFLRWDITLRLPRIIKPIANPRPSDAYDERVFGVSVDKFHLCFKFGAQNSSSNCTKRWAWYFPWAKSRSVRNSLYGIDGKEVWSQCGRELIVDSYAALFKARDEVPKVIFRFLDYDGSLIEATTYISESEYRRGSGDLWWIGELFKPQINRSLDIRFNREVGHEKGSWKGGMVGTSIPLRPGELHEAAFLRYCIENKLTTLWRVA